MPLLEKVEELTLYTLAQESTISSLVDKIDELEKKLESRVQELVVLVTI